MSDISYEILDLMKEYGESRQGLDEALGQDHRLSLIHISSPGNQPGEALCCVKS